MYTAAHANQQPQQLLSDWHSYAAACKAMSMYIESTHYTHIHTARTASAVLPLLLLLQFLLLLSLLLLLVWLLVPDDCAAQQYAYCKLDHLEQSRFLLLLST
jgi:hemolysin-activating ACP:hemolysin acyltransferase